VTSSLEELLRDTLHAHTTDAPDAGRLLVNVRRGVERRRRNHVAAVSLLAAASVVAVIMAVAVAISVGSRHATTPVSPPPIVATTTPSPSSPATSTSTSTEPPTTASTAPVGVPLTSVDWQSVSYPLATRCAPVGVRVVQVAYPNPTGNTPLAAVLVECNAGAGTPPVVLYVYDGAVSTRQPHLASTLVSDTDEWQAASFSAAGTDLTMNVAGFSSATVPNCCPDVHTQLVWRWTGSGYQLVSTVPPHARIPIAGF
jgi:hypothetical protein